MFSNRYHSARVLCRMADQLGYMDSGNIKEREGVIMGRKEPNPRPEDVGAVKPSPPPAPPPIMLIGPPTAEELSRLKKALWATYTGCQPPGRIEILKGGILITREVGLWERVKHLFCGCTRSEVIK